MPVGKLSQDEMMQSVLLLWARLGSEDVAEKRTDCAAFIPFAGCINKASQSMALISALRLPKKDPFFYAIWAFSVKTGHDGQRCQCHLAGKWQTEKDS